MIPKLNLGDIEVADHLFLETKQGEEVRALVLDVIIVKEDLVRVFKVTTDGRTFLNLYTPLESAYRSEAVVIANDAYKNVYVYNKYVRYGYIKE